MDPNAIHEPYHQYHINADRFDSDWQVEVGVIAPDHFQKGGGLQLRFFRKDSPDDIFTADDLLDPDFGLLTGEKHAVGRVEEHSFSDLK